MCGLLETYWKGMIVITNSCDWLRQDCETGQWFRVLIRGGGEYIHQVELPLIPVRSTKEEWAVVSDVWIIRKDMRTDVDTKSRWTHTLPDDVYYQMVASIGPAKTEILFNGNLYSLIDWARFAQHDDNGCALSKCRKEFAWHFESTYLEGPVVVTTRTNEFNFLLMHAIHNTPDMLMIGGVSVHLPEGDLLIFGYYHITTGYVCFNLEASMTNQRHTSKFSQRLKNDWQKELIESVKQLRRDEEITLDVEASILKMIQAANSNLMTFNLNSL